MDKNSLCDVPEYPFFLQFLEPLPPENFTAVPVEDSVTSLDLTWVAPSDGGWDSYNLTYFSVGSDGADEETITIGVPGETEHTLGGLAADTLYQLTLQAVADGEISDPVTIQAKTSKQPSSSILPYFGKRKQVTFHLSLSYLCFHILPGVLFFQAKCCA